MFVNSLLELWEEQRERGRENVCVSINSITVHSQTPGKGRSEDVL